MAQQNETVFNMFRYRDFSTCVYSVMHMLETDNSVVLFRVLYFCMKLYMHCLLQKLGMEYLSAKYAH